MTDKNKKKKQGIMRLLEIAGQKKWKLFISGFLAVISAVLEVWRSSKEKYGGVRNSGKLSKPSA